MDFTLHYAGRDEMGRLAASFDRMRSALLENNRLMWRQVEQRKRLNAAFAHDLRAPLTVLRGHLEMMEGDAGPGQQGACRTMTKQVDRLRRYVESMSSLQKLEDVQPQYGPVATEDFVQFIGQMAVFLCGRAGKTARVRQEIHAKTLVLDESIVGEVLENIVSNAVRHAHSDVCIRLWEQGCQLCTVVSDDGGGFSAEGLQRAAEPYYTGSARREKHFGLGLYISRVLARHHGGDVRMENGQNGAWVTATFRLRPEE